MFRIVCRGWNCAEYIDDCLFSIMAQTRSDWTATLMIDSSTDGSRKAAEGWQSRLPNKFKVYSNMERKGVCWNMYHGILYSGAAPEDIICCVDLDDCLPYYALDNVAKKYHEHPDTLCTYGSWADMNTGVMNKRWKAYSPDAKPRKDPWMASHMKTFKYKVFDGVPKEYFMHKEKWGSAASDLALMFCIMERAGMDRCKRIKDITYIYRSHSPISLNRGTQKKWEKRFRAKKPLERVRF